MLSHAALSDVSKLQVKSPFQNSMSDRCGLVAVSPHTTHRSATFKWSFAARCMRLEPSCWRYETTMPVSSYSNCGSTLYRTPEYSTANGSFVVGSWRGSSARAGRIALAGGRSLRFQNERSATRLLAQSTMLFSDLIRCMRLRARG